MACSFFLHPVCHGSIPFFSTSFNHSQEAEGKERLALFSAFPKSIWSTAWGMWTLLLNSDGGFSHASSVSSVNNSIFIVSLRIWGLGKCASFFWVVLKGAVSAVRQCLGMLPHILLNYLLCALTEGKLELSTSVHFSFGQYFLSRKGGGSWTGSVGIWWQLLVHGFQKLYHQSASAFLVELPHRFFTGNFHCFPFNLLAHSSCTFFIRILHRKSLLFPCPGCSIALLPLAVFHSRFSPFSCSSPGTHHDLVGLFPHHTFLQISCQ